MSTRTILSAATIASGVQEGTLRASDVIRSSLDSIAEVDGVINAFTDLVAERALHAAEAIDAAVERGRPVGPLAGTPFAVKNLFDIRGLPTRAGSKINRELPPAERDAVLIERLEAAGGVLVGGLNMGEFAYDFTGENAHDGACRNPHDTTRMSGGSSSGSGGAVGGAMVPLALGSDTNGSIRVPSSFCGVFGLKPTYGRLPRSRTFPFCDSLDHLGPLTRTVADLALAYDAMQGHDPGDPACVVRPIESTADRVQRGADGLRLAVADGYFSTDGLPEAAAAVEAVATALGAGSTVDIPGAAEGRAASFVITNIESATLHLRNLRARANDFDPDTRDRFLAGAMLPGNWLVRAQQVRRWFQEQVEAVFADVDVIIAPATPFSAPALGQKRMTFRGEDMALRPNIGLFTQPISGIGLPVVAAPIPGAGEDGRPIGVQLIAAPWREDLCLRVAAELERAGVAHSQTPPI